MVYLYVHASIVYVASRPAFISLYRWGPQSYNNKTSITYGQQDYFITLLNWWL